MPPDYAIASYCVSIDWLIDCWLCSGYYAVLPSAAQSDLSHLHRHLLNVKGQVSAMSAAHRHHHASASGGSGGSDHHGGGSDDGLTVIMRQSDSSTL